MASYTMQLREYIDHFSQFETLPIRDRIEKGRPFLFDFDYPIFDASYKNVFETHFIRNFYMREIGFETESLFKFQLENWLTINMPYFNKLFESELIQYDPLTNSKIDRTLTKTRDKTQNDVRDIISNGTTTGNNTSTTIQDTDNTITEDQFNRRLESNNPDSRLSITPNIDGSGVIEYASRIDENKENNTKNIGSHTDGTVEDDTLVNSEGTQNDTLTSTILETDDFIESKFGKSGSQSYSKMIEEYRNSLIRIENKIFKEMQQLFMLVY